MALTRIKTNQITDLAVTTAKLAANSVTAAKLENNLTYGSDFTVSGNLTVSGTTTSVSTTNTRVEDAIIALSAEASGSASVDSGLLINRGSDDNQAFLWDESADQFILANVGAEDGDTAGNVTISSYAGLQAGAIIYSSLNDGTTTLTSTVAELNALDGITADVNELNLLDGVTATTAELNHTDGVTSNIQTQLDAKLALAGGTMSGNIAMGTNSITGMADPSSAQDAATKAYVDSSVSSGSALGIAGDSGTDTVTVGTDTFTISGTANEVTTAVTDNTVTIGLPDDVTIGGDAIVTGNLTVNGTTTTISTTNSVVSDNLIELNTGAGSNANDSGIVIERGSTGDNAIIAWDESADGFIVGTTTATGASTGDLTITAGAFTAGAITMDSASIGGGFGSTGVTISNAGVIQADGALTVNGLASLDGGIDVDGAFTVADTSGNVATTGTLSSGAATLSSAQVSDLTSGRVVLAGTSGELEDSGNLTFDGSTLAVTGAITTSSNVDIADAGSLRVGTGNDFTINHDGTDTQITNGTGILKIDGTATSSIRINEAGANVDTIIEGDSNASLVVVDASGDNVGIGGAPNANVVFDINDTGAMKLAVGTTAQRPTGVTGMFRYNSTTNQIEYYDNSGWESVSTAFTLASSQTFNGDDSTVAFTLSTLTGADSYTVAGVLVMLNGVVQEPTTVYGISGVTLTFTTAPATGDLIEVRKFTTTTTVVGIADSDGDTQIQVEESSDEDVIRFDVAGAQIASITTAGIVMDAGKTLDGTATSAQYADLAEMYAADEEIAPGTVVHFAGEGKLAACDIENCRSVAGIVSTDPAYLMNSVQEGVALALAGRVPTKVTGAVAAGDLMVSAGNGMAMANNEAAMGTVIGKAIEAHEGGEGVIEVLALMM